jgi:hypothetical protein
LLLVLVLTSVFLLVRYVAAGEWPNTHTPRPARGGPVRDITSRIRLHSEDKKAEFQVLHPSFCVLARVCPAGTSLLVPTFSCPVSLCLAQLRPATCRLSRFEFALSFARQCHMLIASSFPLQFGKTEASPNDVGWKAQIMKTTGAFSCLR